MALNEIATLLNREPTFRSLKQSQRPIGLSRKFLPTIMEGYSVTEKADGTNCLLAISDQKGTSWWLDNSTKAINLKPSVVKMLSGYNLFECEFVEGHGYLVFDALVIGSEDVTGLTFHQRYQKIKRLIGKSTEQLFLKAFYFPKKYRNIIKYNQQILRTTFPYETDGLIFTPQKSRYYEKAKIYKWKPPHLLTVDFLIQEYRGKMYCYCGINQNQFRRFGLSSYGWYRSFQVPTEDYFPIRFKPKGRARNTDVLKSEETKYIDTIAECRWDHDGWIPLHIRADKTDAYCKSDQLVGPNNWIVAQATLREAMNPLTEVDVTKM